MNQVAQAVSEALHATRGPSGADTWSNCAGSVAAQAGMPDTDNEHSLRGTAGHHVVEWVATGALPAVPPGPVYEVPVTLVDGSQMSWPLNQEDLNSVQVAVDFVNDQRTEDCDFAAEHRTNPGPACQGDDMWGTMDLRFFYPAARYLHVADYKHGRSPVEVEGNRQTILYAIGEADALIRAGHDVQTVRLSIIQPRRSDSKPAISSVEMTINDLWEWVPFFAEARRATDDPNAPRTPGETQCKWCTAADCPEAAEFNTNTLTQTNQPVAAEVLHMPERPDMLNEHQLAVIVSHAKQARDWLDKVETYVLKQAEAGVAYMDLEGQQWGPVDKQTKRRWKFGSDDTMKKLSNKLKTVNKDLPKEDKLGIDTYRGHQLLSFTAVLEKIGESVLPDDVKGKLITAVSDELIEKPIPGKKLGVMPTAVEPEPTVVEPEPVVGEFIPADSPAPALPDFLS